MRLAKQVAELIRIYPEKWKRTQFRLVSKEYDIEIWVANGLFFITLDKPFRFFNLWDKLLIYRAIRKWEKIPLDLNTNEQETRNE